jgi:hypothetical protein
MLNKRILSAGGRGKAGMLNKRILSLSPAAGKDAVKIVFLSWVSLLANIGAPAALSFLKIAKCGAFCLDL